MKHTSFFFYKPISVSSQMKQIRYIGITLKQDETVQTPRSMLVTKQGETKCNNESDTILSLSIFFFFFFLINPFLFCNK